MKVASADSDKKKKRHSRFFVFFNKTQTLPVVKQLRVHSSAKHLASLGSDFNVLMRLRINRMNSRLLEFKMAALPRYPPAAFGYTSVTFS